MTNPETMQGIDPKAKRPRPVLIALAYLANRFQFWSNQDVREKQLSRARKHQRRGEEILCEINQSKPC